MQTLSNKIEFKTLQELVTYAIYKLKDSISPDRITGADLHNELFNTDYFIIGYYAAEQWLIANGGVFNAIGEIQEYEKDNFGEVNTDCSSSEKVVNMYVYILGEQLLNECDHLQKCWDNKLSKSDINKIIKQLQNFTK